jgi:hypothetical protein
VTIVRNTYGYQSVINVRLLRVQITARACSKLKVKLSKLGGNPRWRGLIGYKSTMLGIKQVTLSASED